ncbi:MAG: hypothetical protein AB2745_08685 [Candidatus Thiodiazotropha endolucinida]
MQIPIIYRWEVPCKGFKRRRGYRTAFRAHADIYINKPIGERRPFVYLEPGDEAYEKVTFNDEILLPRSDEVIELDINNFSGLFMTFAHSEPTRDGILKFASKYGLIGVDRHTIYSIEAAAISDSAPPDALYSRHYDSELYATGESIILWMPEINEMKNLVQLWLNIEEYSEKYINWKSFDVVRYKSFLISSSKDYPEIHSQLTPGEKLEPTKWYIMRHINIRLRKAKPQMTMINGEIQPCVSPNNLLTAMWYQFANAVGEDKKYKSCEHCGTYFELGTGRGQATKKFCSESCRVMASRKRNAPKKAD